MSGGTLPSLGKTTGRAGQLLCALESPLCFPCTCRGSLVWGGEDSRRRGLLEMFNKLWVFYKHPCRLHYKMWHCDYLSPHRRFEEPRLQNQTAQEGSPQSLSSSHSFARQPHLSPLGTSVRAKQIFFLNSILTCYHFWPVAFDTLMYSFSIDENPARWVYHAKFSDEKTEQVSDFLRFT